MSLQQETKQQSRGNCSIELQQEIEKFEKTFSTNISDFTDENWEDIVSCYCNDLSEAFMKKFKGKLDWVELIVCRKFSESFIREILHGVNFTYNWETFFYYLSHYQQLSECFIREFQDKVHWGNISYYQKLSESFILEFSDKLNWHNLCSNENICFSESFIEEFLEKVSWEVLGKNVNFSESFLCKYSNNINWDIIFTYQFVSEDLIRKYYHLSDWYRICSYQTLSEEFMQEFIDEIDIYCVCCNQTLSESFILQNIDSFLHCKFTICEQQKLSEEFLRNNKSFRDCWREILMFQKLSPEFIKEFVDEIVLTEDYYRIIEQDETVDDEVCSILFDVVKNKNNLISLIK